MRFEARVRADLVGFNRLNPQLQEKVIELKGDRGHWRWSKARTHAKGKAVAKGARIPLRASVHEVAEPVEGPARAGPSPRCGGMPDAPLSTKLASA